MSSIVTRNLHMLRCKIVNTVAIMVFLADASRITLAAVSLAFFALAYFIVTSILSYRKLRHIPGPWLAAVSQLWLFNATSRGDLYLAAEKVLRKYGVLHLRVGLQLQP